MAVENRHFFPGGNTPNGFFSFYQYLSSGDNKRTFILKGGPGVGKSSFMKRIAKDLGSEGLETEFHHCSADHNSLDGVCFPEIGVTILDGTAPHVVDPKLPGAVDEIINLGEYWHAPSLWKNKETIQSITSEISRLFRKAYGYLRGSRNYYDEYVSYFDDTAASSKARLRELVLQLEEMYLLHRVKEPTYRERHLFATAITPIGPLSLVSSVTQKCQNIVVLDGEPGTGTEYVVNYLYRSASCRGYAIEAYHCVMRPELVEHLVIPQLSLAVVTSRGVHPYQSPLAWTENLNRLVDSNRLSVLRADMECVREASKLALTQAIEFLARAKALHDELETFYVPYMDFVQVDARREHTLAGIRELVNTTRKRH